MIMITITVKIVIAMITTNSNNNNNHNTDDIYNVLMMIYIYTYIYYITYLYMYIYIYTHFWTATSNLNVSATYDVHPRHLKRFTVLERFSTREFFLFFETLAKRGVVVFVPTNFIDAHKNDLTICLKIHSESLPFSVPKNVISTD